MYLYLKGEGSLGSLVQKLRGRTKSNLLLVLTMLLVFAVIFSILSFGNYFMNKNNCGDGNAAYDLSNINFDSGDSTYLNGKWEFYPGRLILSDSGGELPAPELVDVPKDLSSVVKEAVQTENGGCSSYRCRLKNVKAQDHLTAYIPNIASAYRIYINGTIVTSSGIVSDDKDEVWATSSHDSLPFLLEENEEYEMVVEISSKGNTGIYMPVALSNYSTGNIHENEVIALRYILCGIVLLCAVLFIILKYSVNRELYSLWLPTLSFVLALRILITNESFMVSQPLLFDLSFEDVSAFVFASTYIIKLISLIYITKCLNINVKDNVFVAFCVGFLAAAIGINYLPNSAINTYYYLILTLFSSIIDIFIINRLCIEICKKNEYAFLYLLSYLFIIIGIAVDTLYSSGILLVPLSVFMPVFFAAFVFITVIIHAKRIKKMHDYALGSKQLERELESANTAIMISQIQPHFLYNALNTIKSLIKRDPAKAERAVIDFSQYLRNNMDSLTKVDPIPISEELDHVKKYCSIEQLRFSDKLEIFYDIESVDFYVPVLSVQPIVENAIKHGVTKKPQGGSVSVSTYEDEKNYYICVEDDGVGFDVNGIKADNSKSHVGIENITKRFNSIMGAQVKIESEVGRGTRVTVELPKDKNVKTMQESLERISTESLIKEMNI